MVGASGRDHLAQSYRTCARMQRRHDPTFWLATGLLASTQRPVVHALYGFVRGADELVDGPSRATAGPARRAALDAWHGELEHGIERGRSDHPVIAALVDAGRRHGLPLHLLDRYMEAMRVDCDDHVRLRDRAALDHYMDGSAATVGRIMAAVMGMREPEDVARLGVAFQLTNFIRDVPLDYMLGRIYLPGLPEADLRCGSASLPAREQIAQEVGRARQQFAASADAEAGLAPCAQRAVAVARRVYAQVLDRVEANGYDVLGARARLRPWEAAGAALRG